MRPSSAGARSGGSGGVCVNVSYCKYAVVREAASGLGYALVDDQEDAATPWNCFWWDVGVGIDKVMALRAHQRINHWPGMSCLHTKTGLAATLRPMQRVFGAAYDHVHPRTWLLPEEMGDFSRTLADEDAAAAAAAAERDEEAAAAAAAASAAAAAGGVSGGAEAPFAAVAAAAASAAKRHQRRVFIIKPAASCQGRGIHLARTLEDLQDPRAASIAQEYEARPFLVEGLKFDLRIYVLLSSVDPLRLWLFDEGLCRFATTPYASPRGSNLKNVTQHLTNYGALRNSESISLPALGVPPLRTA